MNISKNGKISSLKPKSSGSQSKTQIKEKESFKEEQKTKELLPKETSGKTDAEFWEDCKESKSKSKDKNENSKEEYLTCKY